MSATETIGKLKARVVELEGEVARLKRELAGRPPERPVRSLDAVGVMGGKATVETIGGPMRECIHGGSYGVCRKLGCRAK